jgi:SAM-dependent methyltransferase
MFTSTKISKQHTNRKHHNWLIYKIGDKFLIKHSDKYSGVLYDLGCGESPYRDFFLGYCTEYIGVDWSESVHHITANVIADLNAALPINSDVADTVISISVLEHLAEPQCLLNEAYRILKPGGHLILQVPWQWWIHEAPYDYFRYTPYGLEYMLKKAGFKNINVEPQSGFFSMWILKFNYFSRKSIRGPKWFRPMLHLPLVPIWWFGQVIAPLLDRLDRAWLSESTGYFVTAKKAEID